MKRRWLGAAFLLALTVGGAELFRAGAQSPVAPAPRSGAEIFNECLKCHGTVDFVQRAPRIEGLPAWYVLQQLEKFKAGIRGTNSNNRSELLMGSIFQGIPVLKSDAEIKVVAEHIASLSPLAHSKVVRGDAERGKFLYQSCVPCHGDQGQGNPALKAPPLDVQEDYYLRLQLILIKEGDRGDHPGDVEAKAMRAAISGVDATNFDHIIRYVAQVLARTNVLSTPTARGGQP